MTPDKLCQRLVALGEPELAARFEGGRLDLVEEATPLLGELVTVLERERERVTAAHVELERVRVLLYRRTAIRPATLPDVTDEVLPPPTFGAMLGRCPRCPTAPPLAVVTNDRGTTWEADGCTVCGATWNHQTPAPIAARPLSVAVMSWSELAAIAIRQPPCASCGAHAVEACHPKCPAPRAR